MVQKQIYGVFSNLLFSNKENKVKMSLHGCIESRFVQSSLTVSDAENFGFMFQIVIL